MNDEILERAQQLRTRFDEAFSRPAVARNVGAVVDLLSITVAGVPYALRLDEVSGMASDRKLVPVPSPVLELLGVVALRGEVTPVYSLSALLGHGPGTATRWLAVCTEGQLHAALAFDTLEGHLRIPRETLHATGPRSDGNHHHVRAVVHVGGAARAVISVPSVFATIRKQCGLDRTTPGATI
jgi:chemotaxis signal transduction protein